MKFLIPSVIAILCYMLSDTVALKNPECGLPHSDVGPCKLSEPKWTFDSKKSQCIKFIYGGCKGNDNRFPDKATCMAKCV